MADLIIRNLDDSLLVELKRRAWEEGLPLEESLHRHLSASVNNHVRPTRPASRKTQCAPREADMTAMRLTMHCL